MTMQEIRESNKTWLYAHDICEVYESNAQAIREQAKVGALPFKYVRSGNTTKILRVSFINFMEDKQ